MEELRLGVHKRRHLGREWGSEMLRTASERRGECLVLIGDGRTGDVVTVQSLIDSTCDLGWWDSILTLRGWPGVMGLHPDT